MLLHLTRVAFGCNSLSMLEARLAANALDDRVRLTTRYRPKRADELVGGSLYWIIAHQLVARSPIRGFAERADGRTDIVTEARAIPITPVARRAHQGWRYFEGTDAARDLAGDADTGDMPAAMLQALAGAGLV